MGELDCIPLFGPVSRLPDHVFGQLSVPSDELVYLGAVGRIVRVINSKVGLIALLELGFSRETSLVVASATLSTTASKGGIQTKLASHTINVPISSSRHFRMVRFAEYLSYQVTCRHPKSVVPKSTIISSKKKRIIIRVVLSSRPSSTSRNAYKASLVSARPKSEASNAAAMSEAVPPMESSGYTTEEEHHRCFDYRDGTNAAHSYRAERADIYSINPGYVAGIQMYMADKYLSQPISSSDQKDVVHFGAKGMLSSPQKEQEKMLIVVQELADAKPENPSGPDIHVADHLTIVEAEEGAAATWLVATAAPHHATGNRSLLAGFMPSQPSLFLQAAGDGAPRMQVLGHGSVITDAVVLQDVWYVPGLASNLVSASQLAELDYSIGFTRGTCYIRGAADGTVVGKAHVGEDGLFELDFLKVLPVI